MTKDIFKSMAEQMQPSEQLLDQLFAALDAEDNAEKNGADAASSELPPPSPAQRLAPPRPTEPLVASTPAPIPASTAASAPTSAPAPTAAPAPSSVAAPLPASTPVVTLPPQAQPARKRGLLRPWMAAAACALLVLIGAGVVFGSQLLSGNGLLAPSGAADSDTTKVAAAETGVADYPGTYREAYREIRYYYSNGGSGFGFATADVATSESADAVMESEAPMAVPQVDGGSASSSTDGSGSANAAAPSASDSAATGSTSAGSPDYSETNVQVEGIDEGDIVKTDGQYIYAISGNHDLVIFTADGENSTEVYRQTIGDDFNGRYPVDMMIYDDVLAVIVQDYNWSDFEPLAEYKDYGYFDISFIEVELYDISEPANTSLLQSFGQSGSYSTSRLSNGILYIVSEYWVGNNISEDEPEGFVPMLYSGVSFNTLPVEDIAVMPPISQPTYSVISSLDLSEAEVIDTKAALGGSATVYMSNDNIYVAAGIYNETSGEEHQESVYKVTEYSQSYDTQIVRYAVDEGHLAVAASVQVKGALLNQFALDEYEGNLRLALTISDWGYKVYRDEELDIESYKYLDIPQTNSILVLDANLEVIGSIEGLAEDERIYSVRFTGPVGYIVTYRQMDPLFAVDLSDPTNPQILSELKIPGFSTYLHPYSDGLLLGLGYDATDSVTNGIKLSMFDISDPYDVTELDSLSLDIDYSEATYEHKAVLVSPERDLIGFSGYSYGADSSMYYLLYGYDSELGFVEKARLKLSSSNNYYYSSIRGLYIDGYLYVYSGTHLDVFSMDDYNKVQTLVVDDSEPAMVYPMVIE
jgi:uncharacterized secreted protein with C-terminal beta-propeller domain